jgi:MarR family 2-MHQ and catechol resistance regulon transcriptional repressor
MDCPLHDERLTLAGLFFEAHAGLTAVLERRLEAECGLTVQWFEVLLRLARSPEGRLRMSDLTAQVTLTPSGLTRVVDRLEAAGLVVREACPTDRRGFNAVLTKKGKARIETAVPIHLGHLDELFTGVLDAEERAQLEHALRKVRDRLNPCAIAGAEAVSGSGSPPR